MSLGSRLLTGGYTLGTAMAARPYSWWAQWTGRWPKQSVLERWGRSFPTSDSKNPIWIHAASMGEVRVAGQFAHELAAHGQAVIASSMTEPGYQLCGDVFPAGTPRFRIPFDLPGPLRRMLAHFHPSALVLVETEWWPNLLVECADAGVRIFVINGRISGRALRRYTIGRSYWKNILGRVECFYMRSQQDADRLQLLGVDPERIKASGSLKVIAPPNPTEQAPIPPAVRPDPNAPVWIAGCTRPGEEETLLRAFELARREVPDLVLWLAPRHPNRFDRVAALIERHGYHPIRWSQLDSCQPCPTRSPVVLIDRMGSLASLYVHATVAFVGGSLKPYGGHNPLEPALAGAPVLFGPYMDDQFDAATLLLSMDAATQVENENSVSEAVVKHVRSSRSPAQRARIVQLILDRFTHVRTDVATDMCLRLGISPVVTTQPPVQVAV